jgi:hypothetical protein
LNELLEALVSLSLMVAINTGVEPALDQAENEKE